MSSARRKEKNRKSSLFEPKVSTRKGGKQRQGVRFRLQPFHNISFQLSSPKVTALIANLSITGVGLIESSIRSWPDGDTLKGQFIIENIKYPATLKVVHRNAGILGCSFENPDRSFQEAIDNYFESELAGLKLVRVETKSKTDDEKSAYFGGQNNCELFLKEKKGEIISFSLVYFGHYFEGDGKRLLMAGHKMEAASRPTRRGFSLVKLADRIDSGIIAGTVRFIENIEHLSESKKNILKQIIGKAA